MRFFLTLFLSALLLSSCATKKESTKNAEALYMSGYKSLNKTAYKKAAEKFEKVEIEHPYSKWAIKAKIMGAYSHYRAKQYDDAIMACDRFIRYHPGNKDVAYAYYLKGISYYDQINIVEKDQSDTQRAYDALMQVVLRFPNTEYAVDAQKKINLTRDYMAGQEMDVARFYLNEKNYLSALNRFSEVVVNYQTTSYIPEALFRQVEVYSILGLKKEASNAFKVLDYNYPESKWTSDAKKIIEG